MQWEHDGHESTAHSESPHEQASTMGQVDPGEALDVLAKVKSDLDDVQEALRRLDSGTYGTCEICGEHIGEEQLQRAPAGRWCVDHQP